MSDNKQPQEFDFFQEALKAFDVPTFQETPKPSAPIESAPVPAAREETSDAKPLKPAFWQKWWPAILCAAICIALLVSFLPRTEKTQRRGENWVYGRLSIVAEEMLILVTNAGEHWYVELDGQEVPEMPQVGSMSLWVFYNGEPKETDELNCTKKVKATFVCNTSGKMVSGFTQYGWIYDQITFDLDGDGKREQWLLCNGYVPGIDSVLSSSIAHAIGSYRLIALEEDGSEKYNVPFYPTISGSHVLNSIDGELCLIGVSGEDYVITAICLSGGQVTFECNDVPIDNEPPLIVTSPLMTLTPTEPPTEPPTGPAPSCQIQFYLMDLMDAEQSCITMTQSDWIEIPAEEGNALKNSLDALQWEFYTDEAVLGGGVGFALSMDENLYSYELFPDGTLLLDDHIATVTGEIWNTLVAMMGCDADLKSKYIGYPGEDAEMTLEFNGKSGIVDAHYSIGRQEVFFDAQYGVIGGYLYMVNVAPYVKNSTVLVWRIHEDGTLELRSTLSKTQAFDLPDQLVLMDVTVPCSVRFRLSPLTPPGTEGIVGESDLLVLDYMQREEFTKILSGLQWIEGGDYTPLGTLRVGYIDDSVMLYTLLDGGMLGMGDKHAILGADSRAFIMNLLIRSSTVEPAQAAYTAGDNIWLTLNEAYLFELNYDCTVYAGTYVQLGRVLYLSTTEGASLLFVEDSDGTLEYVENGYGYMLPDGLRFIISTVAEYEKAAQLSGFFI